MNNVNCEINPEMVKIQSVPYISSRVKTKENGPYYGVRYMAEKREREGEREVN